MWFIIGAFFASVFWGLAWYFKGKNNSPAWYIWALWIIAAILLVLAISWMGDGFAEDESGPAITMLWTLGLVGFIVGAVGVGLFVTARNKE